MLDYIKPNKTTLASDLKGTMKFCTVFPAFGALTSVTRNKGIRKAISSLEVEKFAKLNTRLKECNADVFTRGIKLSESYDVYKDVAKNAKTLSNKLAKAVERGDISAWQKFKNLFTKNKVTVESLQTAAEAAKENLKTATNTIEAGEILTKNADGALVAVKELGETSAKDTVKGLFKSELKNKFVLAITIFGAIPRIKDEVIPTFKEKGFAAGMKETARVIVRTAVDFVSNAGFSAVGRAIGTALGSVVPGVGNAIGGMMGDAVGSCISMRLTNKIFDKDKTVTQQQEETPTEDAASTENTEITENTENQKRTLDIISSDSLTGDPYLDKRINTALSI